MNEQDYRNELKVLYDKVVDTGAIWLAVELLEKRRAAGSCAKAEVPKSLDN